jgi:hypothetical protein
MWIAARGPTTVPASQPAEPTIAPVPLWNVTVLAKIVTAWPGLLAGSLNTVVPIETTHCVMG